MTRRRICLWLLVALAIPAQAMAAYTLQLPCFDQASSAAPAVEMDCHSAHKGDAGHSRSQPDCCGDSCPAMTACAVPHATGPANFSQILPDGRNTPVDRYAVPLSTALFGAPFRPPAFYDV